MRPRSFALFALLLPLVLAGCKIDTINSFHPVPAQVRYANFLPDAEATDVRNGDTTIWTAVPAEATTGYVDFEAVQQSFALRIDGSTTDLAEAKYVLNGDQRYTMLAQGTAADPKLIMLPDVVTGPGSNTYRVRFVHLAASWGAVDTYITAPGADIADLSPRTILYGSVGVNADYAPGNYQIRVTEPGTKKVIYDSGTVAFAGDSVVNAVIFSRGSGALVNLALLETTGAATATIVDSSVARVRAINLSPDAGPVNLLADQAALISDLVYTTPSAYAETASGSRVFSVEVAATPGATAAQFARTLVPATDTTVYVTGTAGALTATPLDDDNIPALSTLARLRFVNLVADATTFDVLLDTTVIASAVSAAAVPSYVTASAGTYTIQIRNTATGNPMLSQGAFSVVLSSVYTIYVTGSSAQPSLVIVLDR